MKIESLFTYTELKFQNKCRVEGKFCGEILFVFVLFCNQTWPGKQNVPLQFKRNVYLFLFFLDS